MNPSPLLILCVVFSAWSSANGAPTGAHAEVNFRECKRLSIHLVEMARDLYNKVESPKMTSVITDLPVTIRPNDTCDPQSLQSNKKTCQSRIILALKNYSRIFHKDGIFNKSACSKWRVNAEQIANVTGHLLKVLKESAVHAPWTAEDWNDDFLCRDSVERLYSFSIISARVFSYLASPVTNGVNLKQC
nr:Interleukin-23 p19 [Danio rerio]